MTICAFNLLHLSNCYVSSDLCSTWCPISLLEAKISVQVNCKHNGITASAYEHVFSSVCVVWLWACQGHSLRWNSGHSPETEDFTVPAIQQQFLHMYASIHTPWPCCPTVLKFFWFIYSLL